MKIAITGHTPPRLKGQEKRIKEWAKKQLKKYQPEVIYCGMAQGVDQIIALVAKNMEIPIICCYPYPKNKFHPIEEEIMEGNEVIYTMPAYHKTAFEKRDQFMMDAADLILSVWDGQPFGGTYAARAYAIKKNKTVIDYEGLR